MAKCFVVQLLKAEDNFADIAWYGRRSNKATSQAEVIVLVVLTFADFWCDKAADSGSEFSDGCAGGLGIIVVFFVFIFSIAHKVGCVHEFDDLLGSEAPCECRDVHSVFNVFQPDGKSAQMHLNYSHHGSKDVILYIGAKESPVRDADGEMVKGSEVERSYRSQLYARVDFDVPLHSFQNACCAAQTLLLHLCAYLLARQKQPDVLAIVLLRKETACCDPFVDRETDFDRSF